MIEFKKRIDKTVADREKLLGVLSRLQTCKFGVICGAGTLTELANEKSKLGPGELWFQSQTPAIEASAREQFIGARLFSATGVAVARVSP